LVGVLYWAGWCLPSFSDSAWSLSLSYSIGLINIFPLFPVVYSIYSELNRHPTSFLISFTRFQLCGWPSLKATSMDFPIFWISMKTLISCNVRHYKFAELCWVGRHQSSVLPATCVFIISDVKLCHHLASDLLKKYRHQKIQTGHVKISRIQTHQGGSPGNIRRFAKATGIGLPMAYSSVSSIRFLIILEFLLFTLKSPSVCFSSSRKSSL
jgi:hypothetical protein